MQRRWAGPGGLGRALATATVGRDAVSVTLNGTATRLYVKIWKVRWWTERKRGFTATTAGYAITAAALSAIIRRRRSAKLTFFPYSKNED